MPDFASAWSKPASQRSWWEEASGLSPNEHEAIVRTAADIAHGRLLVMAALGSNTASEAVELARRPEAAGADAILIDNLGHARSAGVRAHLDAIANATELSIILRDGPQ